MVEPKQTRDVLEVIAQILLRSTVLGFLLILFWFGLYMLVPGPMYGQAKWFGLTPHEIDLIHYCGMAFVKMCVLIFFLFPYISIRLVLRKLAQ
jgi:hypothetical protein